MVKDERISQIKNQIAAQGFFLWYILLMASLFYRQVYLQQPVSDYWDIGLTFLAGTLYVVVAGFARGIYAGRVIKLLGTVVTVSLLTLLGINYLQGDMSSGTMFLQNLGMMMVGILPIVLLLIYLNHLWEKRNGLID